jgi:hypothetical protein
MENRNSLLTVHGNLQAEGTATQPITFTSGESTPTPGNWTRIWFADDHGASTLAHVVVEYAGGRYGSWSRRSGSCPCLGRAQRHRNTVNGGAKHAAAKRLVAGWQVLFRRWLN